ncbi:LuxR C-terminal-related transcriptional regulator [Leifsonia sp. 2TAF2]|uniref:LuxR C-terminal-related transcriptional regulator n=1 Tax=Leifsonia sp. 2TAF2 TaxID=3233009 RepID=UPI003F9B6FD1
MTVLPTVPSHAVDRPQLRDLLDVGAEGPLILVVAPAGSGKTVLLAQWAGSLRDVHVRWLELSAADNDAVRLARRLVEELASIDSSFSALDAPLGNAAGGLGDPLIEALAAAFADLTDDLVVVFDDLHRVTNADVIGDLWRLVDMLPPRIHFVFSSRVDLGLGWSRHRLHHGLVEIRGAQLAFSGESATGVLERVSRRRVDEVTAAAVVRRTEGWAAGVQLAGLRLRIHADDSELVEALEESDRLAIDYLSEEVLDALPADRRQALLDLSVLDELSAGLVETVTGLEDGAGFLGDLERESLFVVPVPGGEGRYRFHHLFRDLLRLRLRASDPGAEARLLRIASDWHHARGAVGDAIECLLAARAWIDALELILSRGRGVYEHGETATVARWLATVPQEVIESRPDAVVLRGMVEGMSGRAAIGESLLRSVIGRPDVPLGTQLIARAYAASGVQFHPPAERYLEDGLQMLAAADEAGDPHTVDLLEITSLPHLRTIALISMGRAQLFLGDLDEAARNLHSALVSQGASYAPYRIHGLGSLAIADALAGRLTAAAGSADEALDLARELALLSHPSTADAYLGRALVAIQRGRPESGALALHEGHVRASSNNRTQLLWIAHAASRLIDPQGTDVAAIPPVGGPPPVVSDLLRGIEHRRRRTAGHPRAPEPPSTWSFSAFEDVAGLLAGGDVDAARIALDSTGLPDAPSPARIAEAGALRAWLADLEGRHSQARALLEDALDAVATEQLVHPFVRAGAAVIALIQRLPDDSDGFRGDVVSRFYALHEPTSRLPDPLTARELELLAYLPSRLTNADLARRCFVSVNTVKTHMAHIYRKLDVVGRDAAIARARELGLLKDVDPARAGVT